MWGGPIYFVSKKPFYLSQGYFIDLSTNLSALRYNQNSNCSSVILPAKNYFLVSDAHCPRNDPHAVIFIGDYFAHEGQLLPVPYRSTTVSFSMSHGNVTVGHDRHNFVRAKSYLTPWWENAILKILIILYQPWAWAMNFRKFIGMRERVFLKLTHFSQHQCTLPNSLEAFCFSTNPKL